MKFPDSLVAYVFSLVVVVASSTEGESAPRNLQGSAFSVLPFLNTTLPTQIAEQNCPDEFSGFISCVITVCPNFMDLCPSFVSDSLPPVGSTPLPKEGVSCQALQESICRETMEEDCCLKDCSTQLMHTLTCINDLEGPVLGNTCGNTVTCPTTEDIIPTPPENLPRICHPASLELGPLVREPCEVACSSVECCYSEEEESCIGTQLQTCLEYASCQNLKPNSNVAVAPPNLENLCNQQQPSACERLCQESLDCCSDPECYRNNFMACLTYAPCTGSNMTVAPIYSIVDPAPADLKDSCSPTELMVNSTTCLEACVPVQCCLEHYGGCFEEDPLGCLEYQACTILQQPPYNAMLAEEIFDGESWDSFSFGVLPGIIASAATTGSGDLRSCLVRECPAFFQTCIRDELSGFAFNLSFPKEFQNQTEFNNSTAILLDELNACENLDEGICSLLMEDGCCLEACAADLRALAIAAVQNATGFYLQCEQPLNCRFGNPNITATNSTGEEAPPLIAFAPTAPTNGDFFRTEVLYFGTIGGEEAQIECPLEWRNWIQCSLSKCPNFMDVCTSVGGGAGAESGSVATTKSSLLGAICEGLSQDICHFIAGEDCCLDQCVEETQAMTTCVHKAKSDMDLSSCASVTTCEALVQGGKSGPQDENDKRTSSIGAVEDVEAVPWSDTSGSSVSLSGCPLAMLLGFIVSVLL